MNVTLAYAGHSTLTQAGRGQVLKLVPNLAREAVAFDAPLLQPLRFREAISALHDCVVSDLRFKKRDKSAYKEWKKNEGGRERVVRKEAQAAATAEIQARAGVPVEADFSQKFERL